MLRQIECHTAIDVGANRGQFALALRHCFPEAKIFSFEPLSEPASLFRHLFRHDKRVVLHETAIGPESKEATIHISGKDDSSSLLAITPSQARLFPGTAEAGTATVSVGRLTEFVTVGDIVQPSLLKLDVQGYELEALDGCDDVLSCFTWIYVEASFVELYNGQALAHQVILKLWERGFYLCGVYNIVYDKRGRTIQGDFLFATARVRID
jgi:FkbM family methyltransferase